MIFLESVYTAGGGRGEILLNWVECNGREETLFDCGQGPFPCRSHNEDVGVTCRGNLASYLNVVQSNT